MSLGREWELTQARELLRLDLAWCDVHKRWLRMPARVELDDGEATTMIIAACLAYLVESGVDLTLRTHDGMVDGVVFAPRQRPDSVPVMLGGFRSEELAEVLLGLVDDVRRPKCQAFLAAHRAG